MPKVIHDNEIFDATVEVMLKHGYAGATTKSIAQSAGVSEATLFRKYGNKNKLIAAAINYHFQDLSRAEMEYTGDLHGDLLAVIKLYDEASAKDSELFPLIVSEIARYPDLRQTLDVPMRIILKLTRLISKYQIAQQLKNEDPLTSVITLLGPIILSKMLRNASVDIPIPAPDLDSLVDLFIAGRRTEETKTG